MKISRLATILMATGTSGPAIAQGLAWSQAATGGPAPRVFPTMAHDSLRSRTVMFGGNGGPSVGNLPDTWEWDGGSWSLVASNGPSARNGHAMSFDSQRGKVVLFGGAGVATFGDTWEWDGTSWTPHIFASGPSPRIRHAMAYDSHRGQTVLFGGHDGSYRGDTWVWDGLSWSQAASGGPPARIEHAMAYDSQRNQAVLFGGSDGTIAFFGDTWVWDGVTWNQVATTGPSGRVEHAMAYDGRRGKTVLFGGHYMRGDTWEWDGLSWTPLAIQGPTSRQGHAMAYDAQAGRSILFGGISPGTAPASLAYLADTWHYEAPLSPSMSTTFGAGCGNPSLVLAPSLSAGPIINSTAQLFVSNVPSTLAFISLGWSASAFGTFSLPIPLAAYGMPGCTLLQSSDAMAPTTSSGPGATTYSLPLPNWGGLLGLHLYLQGWAPAPGQNAGGIIVSNGVEWVIGNT